MKHPISLRSRLAACVGAALLGSLAVVGSASAIAPPSGLTANPGGVSSATEWNFAWDDVSADDGYTFARYEAGAVPEGGTPTDVYLTPGAVIQNPPENARVFRVRAVQTDDLTGAEIASAWSDVSILPDRTPPTLAIQMDGTLSAGWYRSLTIRRTPCGDPGGSGLAAGSSCEPVVWNQDGRFSAEDVTVTDLAGLSTTVTRPEFNFDDTPPVANASLLAEPSAGAKVADEPTFSWFPGEDATSGVKEYVLEYRTSEDADADRPWISMARVPDDGRTDVSYQARSGVDLPQREELLWRVRTIDKAGNEREPTGTRIRSLTIDPTVPAAPTITGGPNSPTRQNSPTFTWTGTHPLFFWDVTVAGSQNPIRRGGGEGVNEASASSLPDGDYVFRVLQVTEFGRESASATRTFKVDTTAPAAPTILVRPTFPAITAPVFTWATEPGAYSRWTLLNAAGAPIAGPSDTPATSMTLPALAEGPYTFQVQQIDAAGNASPLTSEPFTVLAPLTPAPAPRGGNASIVNFLPRQHATRLKPKPGRILPTRSPVLQWRRGPRGTRLYNLQIFKVTKTRNARAPKITKVLSRFPKGRQFRAPKRVLKAGTCYVWRVWPYTGRAFTPKPVGVSNFCIASSKVLKKKALQKAARKRIAARAARAAIVRTRR